MWFPLHCHSQGSLLDGLSKPADIAKRCAELGYANCAITDHGNMSEIVQFSKECLKRNIKPILGCEFYLCDKEPSIRNKENPVSAHLCVLAKNKKGYSRLVKAVSESNRPENFYHKPRLSKNNFADYAGDLIAFSGHPGSELSNCLFRDKSVYKAKQEEVSSYLRPDYEKECVRRINEYIDIFGRDNFFVEIQLVNNAGNFPALLTAQILRDICKKYGFPSIATGDSHYTTRESVEEQRILICSKFETNLKSIKNKLANNEDVSLGAFFTTDTFHIPSLDEIKDLHLGCEIDNVGLIGDMCDNYSIFNTPMLPKFDCDDADQYLLELCRDGWKNFSKHVKPDDYQIYGDRVKSELEVIRSYPILTHYFLIVNDIVTWYKNRGRMIGPGRGSAAGCLVSRLLNIINVDPIKYELMFERFYNAGRNSADRISLPDIDIDFGRRYRHEVIDYIRQKYGSANVSQISTYGRMMGKEALKAVLRAHSACDNDTMNSITKYIPDEAEIADELQEMREQGEETSILLWVLQNLASKMSEWVTLEDDGTISGIYANHFEQAMRLEGTKKSQGKHASGVVISPSDLSEFVPMVLDKKDNELIAGVDMHGLEDMGLVKFDILGVSLLDKLSDI